jgi:hypothetical protein
MSDNEDPAEILKRLRERDKQRQYRYMARNEDKGLKRVTVWMSANAIQDIDDYANANGISTRGESIESLVKKALQPDIPVAPMREPQPTTSNPPSVIAKTLSEIPDNAVPSRKAAELLGFKSASALDNAIRAAGYQVGFVKPGMKGNGRQAVFAGKGKPERGGPDRNLWRVEEDA